ncbi:hypothetical protein [Neolewinella litorea]|uniref:hypothetical protein n=1 Tax=Neolewinella litorea TaxID=2562452 RepID=UPI0014562566
MRERENKFKFWQSPSNLLRSAPDNSDHPFALPTFCTTGPEGVPRPRIVVLRAVDAAITELRCYTDRRSVKAEHLAAGSEGSYLFWDPDTSLQVMAGGPTHWAPEDEARNAFRKLPKHGRKAYATVSAPGTKVPHPTSGLPEDWDERQVADTDYAIHHFGILITRLRWADVLHLDRQGNTRMTGSRSDGGDWYWEWAIP